MNENGVWTISSLYHYDPKIYDKVTVKRSDLLRISGFLSGIAAVSDDNLGEMLGNIAEQIVVLCNEADRRYATDAIQDRELIGDI